MGLTLNFDEKMVEFGWDYTYFILGIGAQHPF